MSAFTLAYSHVRAADLTALTLNNIFKLRLKKSLFRI